MAAGHGGTCFESNAALAALLDAVGIPSVFTVNDRPPMVACHTALLVEADDERFVVDAGFPLYAAVPLPTAHETREVRTRWGTFSASPSAPGRFRIGQHPHPRPLAFELVDRPVSRDRYHAAMCADYGPDGLFLDRVIIKRIVAGDVWRFASGERPWLLERFRDGLRETQPLPDDIEACAALLGAHFGLDAPTVEQALALVTPRGLPFSKETRA
jgi:arylamine N-acetyltransferase